MYRPVPPALHVDLDYFLCLFRLKIFTSSVQSFNFTFQAVASLPEDMRPGPDLYGFPWEVVIAVSIAGAFTIFLFLYRSYQSVSVQLACRYIDYIDSF